MRGTTKFTNTDAPKKKPNFAKIVLILALFGAILYCSAVTVEKGKLGNELVTTETQLNTTNSSLIAAFNTTDKGLIFIEPQNDLE